MTLTLPPLLAAMVAAHNAHDGEAFTACFSDGAIVREQGQKYFGKTAIRTWFDDLSEKYNPVFHVTGVATRDGEPVLTGQISGKFDGSPAEYYYFTGLEDGKIVALKIAPK